MSMVYEYDLIGTGVEVLAAVLASAIPSTLLAIAAYVLSSLALYTLANRRGISHAWLSWVPVANMWILGSLSDQYRYVVRNQQKSKRKSLLVLSLLNGVLTIVMVVMAIVMVVNIINSAVYGLGEDAVISMLMGPVLSVAGLALLLAGITIASMVIRFMALYDVYISMDPGNAVLFLVLSILFNVTEPFFLFFNREKDGGMPPRKPEPQWIPPEETWQTPGTGEYL